MTMNTTISDAIKAYSGIEKILKKYDLDVCTNVDSTLNELMDQNFAPPLEKERFLSEILDAQLKKEKKDIVYDHLELDELANHIEQKHHKYIEEKIPIIKQHLERIVSVHGNRHPELRDIQSIFNEASGELAMHLKKEELILFPFIRKMVIAKRDRQIIDKPGFDSIEIPIGRMHSEHNDETESFRQIRELSNHYTVPKDGCGTYAIAFSMLREFEEDLLVHIEKENQNLFKRSIVLEKELKAAKLIV